MTTFKTIRARADKRKGGRKALAALLPAVRGNDALVDLGDDRVLAEMTRRIFCSGFVWRVIEQKWPRFEEAFLSFDVAALNIQPDEFWESLTSDSRIVRHPLKIRAVRDNAVFVASIASQYGSFGTFLATWPGDQIGLMEFLSKHGSRLGGRTGQYLLRFLGWDGFVLSGDVVACLRDSGVEISPNPSSRKELRLAQEQLTAWVDESGLPMTHVSRICALSTGENYDADTFEAMAGGED